ncbi:hypothetical protein EVJ58_g6700 [Rhodofomes roseus]|uniref:Uncharacterized protein n=1 Tax=Rhodofomes roseus TaxID=34475 RepID=A0A4Y9Y8R4_9APHY|nr:hypothetical protein EVJ58_g6700 [Rhodofomes roseus]
MPLVWRKGGMPCVQWPLCLSDAPSSVCNTLVAVLVTELPSILPIQHIFDLRLALGGYKPVWPPAVVVLLQSLYAVESCTIWVDREVDKKYWRTCLKSEYMVPLPQLKSLQFVGELPTWYKPFWAMGLAIGRAKRGHPLEKLTLTAVRGFLDTPNFVRWVPKTMTISGQRMAKFVQELKFNIIEYSPMDPPDIGAWDGEV